MNETRATDGLSRRVSPFGNLTARTRIRRRADRWARRLVSLGGAAVIGSILAIFIVIAAEVYPLFRKPLLKPLGSVPSGCEGAMSAIVDEYQEIAFLVTEGGVRFVSLRNESSLDQTSFEGLAGKKITGVSAWKNGLGALGLSDGSVLPLDVTFDATQSEEGRKIEPGLAPEDPIPVLSGGNPVGLLAFARTEKTEVLAVPSGPREILLWS